MQALVLLQAILSFTVMKWNLGQICCKITSGYYLSGKEFCPVKTSTYRDLSGLLWGGYFWVGGGQYGSATVVCECSTILITSEQGLLLFADGQDKGQ